MSTTNKIIRIGTLDGRNVSEHGDGSVMVWAYNPTAGEGGPVPVPTGSRGLIKWGGAQMVVIELTGPARGGELALAPYPMRPVKLSEEALSYGARTQVSVYDHANHHPDEYRVVSGPIPGMATGWISELGGLRGLVALYPPA